MSDRKGFDKEKEFLAEVAPLAKQLKEACERNGIGMVAGFCLGRSLPNEETGEEGDFNMAYTSAFDDDNSSCHLVACDAILDGDDMGHQIAHVVMDIMIKASQAAEIAQKAFESLFGGVEEGADVEEFRRRAEERLRELYEKQQSARFN